MSQIPTRTRTMVALRDGGQCIRCGGRSSALHHRRRRRETHGSDPHSPANVISLCSVCHAWVHANPRQAVPMGWIVLSTEPRPGQVPIFYFVYDWVQLDPIGRFRLLAECKNCGVPSVVAKTGWCGPCLVLEGEAGEADLRKLREEADHERA